MMNVTHLQQTMNVTHLLHCTPDGNGINWWLTCEDSDHTTCATIVLRDDGHGGLIEARLNECFLLEWWNESGVEMLDGEWPTDPVFPIPVTWAGVADNPVIVWAEDVAFGLDALVVVAYKTRRLAELHKAACQQRNTMMVAAKDDNSYAAIAAVVEMSRSNAVHQITATRKTRPPQPSTSR